MFKPNAPCYVVVANGRYDIVGIPTLKNRWLAKILMAQGGVADSVEDGTYIFSAKGITRHGLKVNLELVPTK